MKKKQNESELMKAMMRIALLLSFIVFGYAHSSHAQTNVIAPPGVEDQITVHISPEIPQPKESITIRIESFSTNINKAYIVWTVNGVVKDEGPGKTSFSFTTGDVGTSQKVGVSITTEDRRIINKSYTFAPAKLGLVVESDTYTPPFYKGKALFTPESTLKVVSFPEFVTTTGYRIPAENLIYTWSVDGKVVQASSGYGKSSLIMQGNLIPRPITVTAKVSAHNSPLIAEETIQVNVENPEIVLYEDSLLYGILRQQGFTSGMYLPTKEIKLMAEPYFLSVDIPASADAIYHWTLNGQTVPSLSEPHAIGLENRSGEAGVATLALSMEHLKKLLQAPSLSLQIEFAATQ